MLTWTEALGVPLIVLAVHAVVIPWRWKWRLASRVTLVSLGLTVIWFLVAAIDAAQYVDNPRVTDDDYVGLMILLSVVSCVHLTLLTLALCICLPFDRWKHNR